MSSSTSGSKAMLAAALIALVCAALGVQFVDKSYVHTGPEYAMSEATRAEIKRVCARDHVGLVIVGDSRAVAGVDGGALRAAGYDVEKLALGASGPFVGWAILDWLSRCPVHIDNVLMAYGEIHIVESGALMERTTNFGFLRGSESAPAYAALSAADPSFSRRIAYRAMSLAGAKATFIDFVLFRPALKTILKEPAHAFENRKIYEQEYGNFLSLRGDRYYGTSDQSLGLPQESELNGTTIEISPVSLDAARRIAELARKERYRVAFYTMPVSDQARTGLDPNVFARMDDFIATMRRLGVRPLNGVWSLPAADFGDPNHVNARGRAAVTADLLPRLRPILNAPAHADALTEGAAVACCDGTIPAAPVAAARPDVQ